MDNSNIQESNEIVSSQKKLNTSKHGDSITFRAPDVPPVASDKLSQDYMCGLWKWRPAFLQVCCNIQTFIVVCSIACIMQTALTVGYIASQMTTLEKRFGIKISTLGATSNAFEISYILLVTFVTYFGSKGRIPVWLANGLVMLSLSCIICALPHFITESHFVNTNSNNINKQSHQNLCNSTSMENDISCEDTKRSYLTALICIVIGQLLFGIGSSPFLTLGPIYVDDHISSRESSTKIAILHASSATGPVFGFVIGSVMDTFNADMFSDKIANSDLTPDNPNWIGAWWAGFIIISIICLLTAFMLYLFPSHLPSSRSSSMAPASEMKPLNSDAKNESEASTPVEKAPSNDVNNANAIQLDGDDDSDISESGRDDTRVSIASTVAVADFPGVFSMVLNLIKNKIYVITLMAITCELFILVGISLYMVKFLEEVYHLTKLLAGISAGLVMIPFGALGIVVGGLFLSKKKLNIKQTLVLIIAAATLNVIVMLLSLFVRCDVFVGKTVSYSRVLAGENKEIYQLNSSCNTNCNCNAYKQYVIHDKNSRLMFYSPCYAGCSKIISTGKFTNCTCLSDSKTVLEEGKLPCRITILLVGMLAFCLFLIGLTQNPLQMIILRTVKHKERPVALGIQFVIIRLFSFIPAPNVYGKLVDWACLKSNTLCGREECLINNNRNLTVNIISVSTAFKILATILYVILLILFHKQPHNKKADFFSRNANNISFRRSLQLSSKRHSSG